MAELFRPQPLQEKAQTLAATISVKAVVIKLSCWTESK
jgi:hypothetical protein